MYEPKPRPLNHAFQAVGLGLFDQSWLGQESTAMYAIIGMSQWQGFGYSTLLFAVAIQRIPSELYGAAAIDGTGPIRRFIHVTVPLVREMTGLMTMVTISGAFQVFNEVMVMTSGGPNNSTQVRGTWLYRSGFVRNNFGYAAAIATLIFVITLGIAMAQLWVTADEGWNGERLSFLGVIARVFMWAFLLGLAVIYRALSLPVDGAQRVSRPTPNCSATRSPCPSTGASRTTRRRGTEG
ncbi:hypothetical protein GCM10020219_055480 [Nonomuraea dietziae]